MNIFSAEIFVSTKKGMDIVNITHLLGSTLAQYKIREGILTAFITGSTGSITTIEYEPGVIKDLKRIINNIAPEDSFYEHEKAWHDGNGHSHVQAALLGPSITVPVRNSQLELGTWQQIVLINHDVRARKRKVIVTIIGK